MIFLEAKRQPQIQSLPFGMFELFAKEADLRNIFCEAQFGRIMQLFQHLGLSKSWSPHVGCHSRDTNRGAFLKAALLLGRARLIRLGHPLKEALDGLLLEVCPASLFQYVRDLPHSFQGSFFLENLRKPMENGGSLKTMMVEKNGESTPRNMSETFLPPEAAGRALIA